MDLQVELAADRRGGGVSYRHFGAVGKLERQDARLRLYPRTNRAAISLSCFLRGEPVR